MSEQEAWGQFVPAKQMLTFSASRSPHGQRSWENASANTKVLYVLSTWLTFQPLMSVLKLEAKANNQSMCFNAETFQNSRPLPRAVDSKNIEFMDSTEPTSQLERSAAERGALSNRDSILVTRKKSTVVSHFTKGSRTRISTDGNIKTKNIPDETSHSDKPTPKKSPQF